MTKIYNSIAKVFGFHTFIHITVVNLYQNILEDHTCYEYNHFYSTINSYFTCNSTIVKSIKLLSFFMSSYKIDDYDEGFGRKISTLKTD